MKTSAAKLKEQAAKDKRRKRKKRGKKNGI
jgi:hypothetical protein